MRVGLVFGGNTTECEVSKSSASGIRGALQKLGHEIVDIEFDKDIPLHILDANVDVIYNSMHGQYGEDGCLQGLLDIMQIPYTHSGRLASALAMNKQLCNNLFKGAGIRTIKGFTVSKERLQNDLWKEDLKNSEIADKTELFCKPVCDGSSVDAFAIENAHEFSFKETTLHTKSKNFLIEERIHGREIQVAVLGHEPKAIGMLEVKPNGEFYDYKAKYSENGAVHCDVEASEEVKNAMLETAVKIHNLIGLKDISRSEFLLTKDEDFYVLEVNSHPGFTQTSIVPEIAAKAGIKYEEIVEMLLKNASYGG